MSASDAPPSPSTRRGKAHLPHVQVSSPDSWASPPGSPNKSRFATSPRFRHAANERIPNFLNGRDGQGNELPSQHLPTDTCTHTSYRDAFSRSSAPSFVDDLNKSLMGRSSLASTTGRVDSPLSLTAGDPRFLALQAPYSEPLGPGSYDLDHASPSMGPYLPDSPLRGSNPARDPNRPNSPFKSPPRSPLFKISEFAGLPTYLTSSYKGLSDKAPKLYCASIKRPDVSDYRYSTRHSEARKEVPAEIHDPPVLDSAGRVVAMADKVPTKPALVPFMSGLPRFADRPRTQPSSPRQGPHVQHQLIVRLHRPVDGADSCPSSPTAAGAALYASYATYVVPNKRSGSTGRFDRLSGGSRPASVA